MVSTKADQYDLVIVGGGASGFAAAYEAGAKNLKTLLVEKGHTTGGSGEYVEGIFAVDSSLQKEAGVTLTKEQVLNEELSYSHYKADTASWKEYIDESADVIDWLKKLGAEYIDVQPLGSGFQTWHLFKGLGKQVIHGVLEPQAIKLGVEIITSVEATQLNLGADKQIESIELTSPDGSKKVVSTKAVILATGGYLNNKDLIKTDTQYDADRLIPVNSGKNTGDGLQLAWKVGAKKYAMGMAMLFGGYIKDDQKPAYVYRYSEMNGAVTQQSLLWVNETGKRFVNEEVVDNFSLAGNALTTQNKVYTVLDQATIDRLTDKGLLKAMGTWDYREPVLPNLKSEVKQALADKSTFITQADSIEELASKLALPDLPATVSRYNQLANNKQDDDFDKDPKYLVPVAEGPFYAFELGVSAFCTMGGLKVNLQNEVLDTQGQVIDGLYAVGNDAAGVLIGDTYGPNMPGTEGGYSFYSGRKAVRELATKLNG